MKIVDIVDDILNANITTVRDDAYLHSSVFKDVEELIEERIILEIEKFNNPIPETDSDFTEKFLVEKIVNSLKRSKK